MDKQEALLKKLIDQKFITKEESKSYRFLAKEQKKDLVDILVEQGNIDTGKIFKLKAETYNLNYENLLDRDVEDKVLNIIPIEAAENYRIICFEKAGNKIKIGIVDPENYKAIEAVNFLAKEENLQVEYYLISELSFAKVFKQYKNLEQEVSFALKTREEVEKVEQIAKLDKVKDMEEITKTAPVAKIVSVIIRHAVEGRASDIHIEPMRKDSRVRYRIDGVLHTSLVLPKNVHNSIIARIKVLASLKLDETRIPQDGRIRLVINEKNIDFRVSILPLVGEEKAVMRILDVSKGAPKLEDLGYQGRALKLIKENIKKTNGMFLITGPTGSGKSTTLFSVLNMLNKDGVNISTLEDPVEYFIMGVNQSQVRPEIDFTFANGLRSLLRQDPDIIMVGEIRDSETAELAIHASLTGHFVLSTLHTNSAIGAIPRLLDMEVESFLLGSTLNIVVAQRLARRICSNCKKEEKLPSDILADIASEWQKIPKSIITSSNLKIQDIKEAVYYKGAGCPRCGNSGYAGRVAIVEALEVNDKIKEMIMSEGKILKLENVLKDQDYTTMKQDGIIKVVQGFTTMEELLRVTRD
ncbi:MAG: GspE/PulE family protein [Patescibacteria group bacterium]